MFPTPFERNVWRAALLDTAALPLLLAVWAMVSWYMLPERDKDLRDLRLDRSSKLMVALYACIRLYLIIEPFAGLRIRSSGGLPGCELGVLDASHLRLELWQDF